jgi:hypothetical protein
LVINRAVKEMGGVLPLDDVGQLAVAGIRTLVSSEWSQTPVMRRAALAYDA